MNKRSLPHTTQKSSHIEKFFHLANVSSLSLEIYHLVDIRNPPPLTRFLTIWSDHTECSIKNILPQIILRTYLGFRLVRRKILCANMKIIFLEFSASSRAVLVQITPVLGVLVGVVVTLVLIAICIVIFVKIKNKVRLPGPY